MNLSCQYCGSVRHNTNSWKNHERCCPQNANRNYKNGMTGKKGTNQFIKAKRLGLPKPKSSGGDTTGFRHSEETKNRIRNTRLELFKEGKVSGKNKIRFYKEHPEIRSHLYICEFRSANEHFIKFGICENGAKKRFSKGLYSKFDIEIIYEKEMTGFEAASLEKEIRTQFKPEFRYDVVEKFNGYTECLSVDAIVPILEKLGSGA